MGLLDWFRGRRGAEQGSVPATAEPAIAHEDDRPQTFIKGRLSEKAQAELRRLRDFKSAGASHYTWECSAYACFESKRFLTEGPYEIAHGLARVSPVPGRETGCECDCHVISVSTD